MPCRPDLMRLLLPYTAALAVAIPASVTAQNGDIDALELSYLYDGGAIPFIWIPLVLDVTMEVLLEPRSTPLWFDPKEGGAPSRIECEVPGWAVGVAAASVPLYMSLDTSPARWFHIKGFSQSMLTSTFIVGVAKVAFGRHRPDYDPVVDDAGARRSFPSGHSASTLAATTYLALYLRHHGFNRWRRPNTLPWWEMLTYTGLAAVSVWVPATRVQHNRHHVSDTLVGSAIGVASSLAFYSWQQARYRRRDHSRPAAFSDGQAIVFPASPPHSVTFSFQF